jgi:hypothetical protein
MKLGMYITAPDPISTAYFPTFCVSVFVFPYVARQPLGKHVTAATNTQTTIVQLLDALFSIRSMSYQRKVGDYFFPELLVAYLYQCRKVYEQKEVKLCSCLCIGAHVICTWDMCFSSF